MEMEKFEQTALKKTQRIHLRVYRFECSAKWKTRGWKTSEFNQSTSEFDQNASEKISEVYISQFSVLGKAQNGKLGVKRPRTNILRDFRELGDFDLTLYLLDIKCDCGVHLVYTV